MTKYGILIDYEWCTGCHSCEFACQMEHQYPVGQTGILVNEIGPWKIEEDVCAARTEMGKLPTCVSHCQAKCMEYGTLEELSAKLTEKPKQAVFALD